MKVISTDMKLNFTPFPELTTDRLVLRQLSMADDKEVFFQRSDKEMNKYVDNPPCQSIEEARAWIEKITGFLNNNESIFWAVCLKGTEKMIGGFCFWNIDKENSKAEIGFTIFPEHQNKGLMNEVLTTALQYGFEEMSAKTIEGYTNPGNLASIKVMQKHGFQLKHPQPEDAKPYVVYELKR
jgi:ribosomal-protein-alanine N-acetyltransferase